MARENLAFLRGLEHLLQASTKLEFGDIDLTVVGPMARQLSQSFDAQATLAYDTPEKASAVNGEQPGQLMWKRVAMAAASTTTDLVIVSPYVVPGASELALIRHPSVSAANSHKRSPAAAFASKIFRKSE